MKNLLASALSFFGVCMADMGSSACVAVILDEPEMPESLIK